MSGGSSSWASETSLPRYGINSDRKFVLRDSSHPAQTLLEHGVVDLFVYQEALTSCPTDWDWLNREVRRVFQSQSNVVRALRNLVPDPLAAFHALNIKVVIDDLGDSRTQFRSFYYPDATSQGLGLIVLDCHSLDSKNFGPTLAHEIAHALLNDKNLESWFDEGIAQSIEVEAGGRIPIDQSSAALRNLSVVPSLFENHLLSSHATYGLTFLFVQYLKRNFGGWPMLQAMSAIGTRRIDSACESEANFYHRIVCRAEQQGNSLHLGNERHQFLTPTTLLIAFALSLSVGSPGAPFGEVPYWQGFTPPEPSVRGPDSSWQFLRLGALPVTESEGSGTVKFKILTGPRGAYCIRPLSGLGEALYASFSHDCEAATRESEIIINMATDDLLN